MVEQQESLAPLEQAVAEVVVALLGFVLGVYLALLAADVHLDWQDEVDRGLVDAILDSLVCVDAQFGNHLVRLVQEQLSWILHYKPGSSNCVSQFLVCSEFQRFSSATHRLSYPKAMRH